MERDRTFDKEHQIRCFGHILNLTAQAALKEADEEISEIRDYIKAIVHSPKRLQLLEDNFHESNMTQFVKPILDVKTRWNSTVDMISRAFRLKQALVLTMDTMYNDSLSRYLFVGFMI